MASISRLSPARSLRMRISKIARTPTLNTGIECVFSIAETKVHEH
jgi:hypothetical protein